MKKTIKAKKATKSVQMPLKGLAGKVAAAEKKTLRSDFPQYKAGDTVKVHTRIKEGDKERIQIYEGVVIALNGGGGSKSFTVRKISHGVGVERIFLESSPKVAKLEVVQEGRVRRAKLYYLRGLEGRAAKIEKNVDQSQATQAAAAAKATK